ncbi:polysaccharide deacetylase family protein [Cohnella sp. CFH 77786]|uniref:polysaccharide deacetylase family protein n=1 Tax=Cohnella sp. CFH 77786 TaxID=2662265 RepID=UPI001C60E987|nr:polysaccharide deacetylase family protein [Cohnella sp. CFH 77786]MBW5447654.1 polysaccharide deacetylase family protein [Cohnella sp. CFH 77786]
MDNRMLRTKYMRVIMTLIVAAVSAGLYLIGVSHYRNQSYPHHLLNPGPTRRNSGSTDRLSDQDEKPLFHPVTGKIYYQNKVAVLTYHHLDSAESSVTITPQRFRSHLEALKEYGFHVISMDDFVAFLEKKKPVPPNAVVITFDDGYESVYKYAYPILKSEGMTATVFLIVGYIEDGAVHQPLILNWKEIMEMHRAGFSFYSHSYRSHQDVKVNGIPTSPLVAKLYNPSANRLETEGEYEARIREDLSEADDILDARLGNRINLLCFPHGRYNSTLVKIARQSDIPYLFTGKEGLNTNRSTLINRINAGSPYVSAQRLIGRLSAFTMTGHFSH